MGYRASLALRPLGAANARTLVINRPPARDRGPAERLDRNLVPAASMILLGYRPMLRYA